MAWEFLGYPVSPTASVIDEWLNDANSKAAAMFESRISFLGARMPVQWNKKHVKALVGYQGLFEMRFQVGNRPYRPLFCFGPQKDQITFLIFAHEHNGRFRPPKAPDTALRRKAEIESKQVGPLTYDPN